MWPTSRRRWVGRAHARNRIKGHSATGRTVPYVCCSMVATYRTAPHSGVPYSDVRAIKAAWHRDDFPMTSQPWKGRETPRTFVVVEHWTVTSLVWHKFMLINATRYAPQPHPTHPCSHPARPAHPPYPPQAEHGPPPQQPGPCGGPTRQEHSPGGGDEPDEARHRCVGVCVGRGGRGLGMWGGRGYL